MKKINTGGELLILVDGSSYLHRAFHGLPPLKNSKGEPTGAIYGVINMLRKLLATYHPIYMATVFDMKGKNFRHELYQEYKANRSAMAEDLKIQIEPLYRLIRAMGIELISVPDVEADDVIGTLAKKAELLGMKVIIATNDKDMAQLVNENITLLNTMNDTQLDRAGIKKKFGVFPEQIVDYLSLVGDSSDNIPGIDGIGSKRAISWLSEYHSLDKLITNAAKITGKVGDSLRNNLDKLSLIKQLVTVRDDLNLDLNPKNFSIKSPQNEILVQLFTHLEFRSWLKELNCENNIIENSYTLLKNKVSFLSWLEQLNQAKYFSFSLATAGSDILDRRILGIAIAVNIGEPIYIPITHDRSENPEQLSIDYVLEKLEPIFTDITKAKLGQNLKHDITTLAKYHIEIRGNIYDTMVESYIVNSTSNHYDNKSLVLRHLGTNISEYEKLAEIEQNQPALEETIFRTTQNTDLALRLHKIIWSTIELNSSEDLYYKIEMPLIGVLSRMECQGVAIDGDYLRKYAMKLGNKLANLEDAIYRMAGLEFNINSPAQLQKVLYDRLSLPILQKTPKGQASTAESVLQELAMEFELPRLILEYRGLAKLKSTYADALPKAINSGTGRIHTSYNQTVTSTGRLSSTNPNLQNIPIRTEEGRLIRKAFIGKPGCKIVTADYSQIELRVMAHLSGDENLIKSFHQGEDIHTMVAAEIFNLDLTEIDESHRRDAKTINFGLIYGMSAFGLAKRLRMPRVAAEKYIELYFNRYPGVKAYMDLVKEHAQRDGYVESIFRRRIYVDDIKSKNSMQRQASERMAINAPIQGSAADIIKLAMIDLDQWIMNSGLDLAMTMQVHDELIFEVNTEIINEVLVEIRSRMENVVNLSIPMVVDVGIGDNWNDAHQKKKLKETVAVSDNLR